VNDDKISLAFLLFLTTPSPPILHAQNSQNHIFLICFCSCSYIFAKKPQTNRNHVQFICGLPIFFIKGLIQSSEAKLHALPYLSS